MSTDPLRHVSLWGNLSVFLDIEVAKKPSDGIENVLETLSIRTTIGIPLKANIESDQCDRSSLACSSTSPRLRTCVAAGRDTNRCCGRLREEGPRRGTRSSRSRTAASLL